MGITRRELLQAGAAAGALLVARPFGALAESLGPTDAYGTVRSSRLFQGTWAVHADLHNHTLLSDGAGDAAAAFASMRDAGLDVAALTDHTTLSRHHPDTICQGPEEFATNCQAVAGINEASWAQTADLADSANVPDRFTALRGFEWSSPTLGHINVWFSQTWTDPLNTAGLGNLEGAHVFLHQESGEDPDELPPAVAEALDPLLRTVPGTGVGMALFYEWLVADPDRPLHGGGLDGIAGFNHPGREPGRFSYFAFEPAVRDRFVSVEVFNRRDDYLFEGVDFGEVSPISQCLDAGWRVGLLGVTDEHGTDWGHPDGKGRAGLWVDELTRDGVRRAMEARRFYATNLKGLRLDASANGIRMGGDLAHASGPVEFLLDVDRGTGWPTHKPLVVQVLRPGGDLLPHIADAVPVVVPEPDEPVIRFTVDLDAADGPWVFLRLTDPELPADGRAPGPWPGFGGAVAYTSPWFLTPGS